MTENPGNSSIGGDSENQATTSAGSKHCSDDDPIYARFRKLPPEVGAVMLGAGAVGLVLPGPIGAPLLIAGGLVLMPKTFSKLGNCVHRRFPRAFEAGMKYVDRFVDDFERRFPPPGSQDPE